jgi:protein tyrosine/serine phosphatase
MSLRSCILALQMEKQTILPSYVVHCIEGKDRTGYVCALLEGLCGATYEEIVAASKLTL